VRGSIKAHRPQRVRCARFNKSPQAAQAVVRDSIKAPRPRKHGANGRRTRPSCRAEASPLCAVPWKNATAAASLSSSLAHFLTIHLDRRIPLTEIHPHAKSNHRPRRGVPGPRAPGHRPHPRPRVHAPSKNIFRPQLTHSITRPPQPPPSPAPVSLAPLCYLQIAKGARCRNLLQGFPSTAPFSVLTNSLTNTR